MNYNRLPVNATRKEWFAKIIENGFFDSRSK